MKSYLSLIPISARVHRRQNRMTLLCIIFAVFLVTAIFSTAEMGARMEQTRLAQKHGSMSFQQIFNSELGQSLLLTAAVLCLLILAAGVLMISGSINSSVAQRTQFFGMMRCIGMSRRQIIRFVRLEALNWCKTAVPIGLILGILCSWGLCAALRFLVREEFSHIPLFGVSIIGIISGIVVGVMTVLIAAGAPAKRASKVPPAAAVSGSLENGRAVHSVSSHVIRIETSLGVHHAVSSRKNLVLLTGSFALSIILFLGFSVLVDFVDFLMPQSAAASDIDISSVDGTNSINAQFLETIRKMNGVKQVYGRRSFFDVPAELSGHTDASVTIDLVSFDDFDLQCLKTDGMLRRGSRLSRVYGNSAYVLATWDKNSSLEIGDAIRIGSEPLTIAGLLKYDPFSSDGLTSGRITLITSAETFARLTGVTDYSLIMVQLRGDATEEDVAAICSAAGNEVIFSDKREQSTSGTYLFFIVCVYGFLAIIALVTILNIINSISMSVSARIRQYGSMRAVGMDGRQITGMIAAEAFTYAFWGCVTGCAIGLSFSRLLYDFLITAHFPYASWTLPVWQLTVIVLFVVLSTALASYAPARRIRRMAVTETINEL